jgi:putative NADPH-quinone reductase
MAKKVLIINGNPARKRQSLCASIAESYASGAIKSGHKADVVHLHKLSFDPILHEGYLGHQELEPDLQLLQKKMVEADYLVFVFPLWLALPPALFKGFIERIIAKGFAYEYEGIRPKALPALKGKVAKIIITCGMPAFFYKWFSGQHSSRAIKTIFSMCGIKNTSTKVFGLVSPTSPSNQRFTRYIATAYKMGENL